VSLLLLVLVGGLVVFGGVSDSNLFHFTVCHWWKIVQQQKAVGVDWEIHQFYSNYTPIVPNSHQCRKKKEKRKEGSGPGPASSMWEQTLTV
jgi:hypothetical protein